jgi:hypothetical protein
MSNPSSYKCHAIIQWSVPRPSLVHHWLTCVTWHMLSTHLQLQHEPISNNDKSQFAILITIQWNKAQHLCELPLAFWKNVDVFSLVVCVWWIQNKTIEDRSHLWANSRDDVHCHLFQNWGWHLHPLTNPRWEGSYLI